MDRFDDERREIPKLPVIILNDGRKFTQKFVFDSFLKDRNLDDRNLRKALYLIAVKQPFKIVFSSKQEEREIDIESLFKNEDRKNVDRSKFEEAKIEIDGVEYDSNSTSLFDALVANGTNVFLNSR